MTRGEAVRVYPHGSPDQAATGSIIMISQNERAIAVAFGDKPPFAKGTVAFHSEFGVVFLAMRTTLNGETWGPWIETANGGHYEIEADYED